MTASGEIDCCTVATFREHLTEALATGAGLVGVDLSRLTFFSVSGLRAVLDAVADARQRHMPLRVVTGPRRVDRHFEVCDQDTDSITVTTIAAACASRPRDPTQVRRGALTGPAT
ncbi:STAS domain-containing protein [Nocardia niigatensis]